MVVGVIIELLDVVDIAADNKKYVIMFSIDETDSCIYVGFEC